MKNLNLLVNYDFHPNIVKLGTFYTTADLSLLPTCDSLTSTVSPDIKSYRSDSPCRKADLCLSKMYKGMRSTACVGIKFALMLESFSLSCQSLRFLTRLVRTTLFRDEGFLHVDDSELLLSPRRAFFISQTYLECDPFNLLSILTSSPLPVTRTKHFLLWLVLHLTHPA